MNQSKLLELVSISQIEGIGPQKLKQLIKLTNSFNSIFNIQSDLLVKIIGANLIDQFNQVKNNFHPKEILNQVKRIDSQIIYFEDEAYPSSLREISDFPPILFVKGEVGLFKSIFSKLAVIGSRKFSAYGREVVDSIIPNLVSANIEIVSGLALGIDALAHQKTLEANGKAIAILGSSLDFIYPQENFYLAREIIDKGGLLVSEFPPGTPPLKQHFPRRNRIIAGLARGVLVIEAALSSGSLITAQLALDYNRDVFAVPGEIHKETSQGTNQLIKNGAEIVLSADDILTSWELEPASESNQIKILNLSEQEEVLINLLSGDPMSADQVATAAKISASQSAQLLSQLELVGMIKNVGMGYYKRIN